MTSHKVRNVKMQFAAGVIFALCCFSFFQFILPYHLFIKEQILLFLYTPDCFFSYLDKPAWLSRYIGDFLTQFFYLRGGGATVLTFVFLLQWQLQIYVFKQFHGRGYASLLALFPCLAEWVNYGSLYYPVSGTISLLLVLSTFLLYIRWRSNRLVIPVAYLLVPLLYSLAGIYMILFPLMLLMYEIRIKDRSLSIIGLVLLLVCLAFLYPVVSRHFYLLTVEQAYLFPLSRLKHGWPLLILLVLIAAALSGKIRTMCYTTPSVVLCIVLFILFLTGSFAGGVNLSREKTLGFATESYFGNWKKVYAMANKKEQSNTVVTYYTNIALSKLDVLPDQLMDYYQPATYGMFLPVNTRSDWLTIFLSSDVFFHLGDMNMAQHSAMLGMIFSPFNRSSRMVKRLSEVNLVNGDTAAAMKYLYMLDATLFHRKWAQRQIRLLREEKTDPLLEEKRKQLFLTDTLRKAEPYLESLTLLVEDNPANKPALDYLLCGHLLNKDIRSFFTLFKTYYNETKPIPRVYSEALLICLAASNALQDGMNRYHISPQIVQDFMRYTRLYEQAGADPEALRVQFPNSYWIYYHFAQLIPYE